MRDKTHLDDIALKWANNFKNETVKVSDWDIAKEAALRNTNAEAIRNADVAYYIFMAVLEAENGAYSRGWNDCLAKQDEARTLQSAFNNRDKTTSL